MNEMHFANAVCAAYNGNRAPVSIAAERLAYAEDNYDRMCRDEDATPAQIEAATAALHAAQAAAS